MEENILVCVDSLEGIFTGIYQAYARRLTPECTRLQIGREGNMRLFAQYDFLMENKEEAWKVADTLKCRLGEEVYYRIVQAAASRDVEKGTAIYRTVARALKLSRPERVLEQLAEDNVRKVFELSRNVWYESHHLLGFLRFRELKSGVLFARIGPKNNVLSMLAEHFADRLPEENFIIHDEGRNLFALHEAGRDWYLLKRDEPFPKPSLEYSREEAMYEELFCHFCHKIAIEERENKELQRNMLPLRFRDYMVEFSQRA